jgi:hypothetical protein
MLTLLGYMKDDAEQRRARLRVAVSSAYDWAFQMPPDTSMDELLTAFESNGNVHGEDRRRAANFLIQAAKELQLPYAFKPRRRGRPTRERETPDAPRHGAAATRRIDRYFDVLLKLLERTRPEDQVDHDLLDRLDRIAAKLVDERRLDRFFEFLIARAAGIDSPNRRVLDSLDQLHSPSRS